MTLFEKFEEVVISNVKNDYLRDLILKHCKNYVRDCTGHIEYVRFIESDLVTSIFVYENKLSLQSAEIVIASIIDNICTDMEMISIGKDTDLAIEYSNSALKQCLEALRVQFYGSIVFQTIREYANIDDYGKWKLKVEV